MSVGDLWPIRPRSGGDTVSSILADARADLEIRNVGDHLCPRSDPYLLHFTT